jgi:curved DNA-binding protein CbpA
MRSAYMVLGVPGNASREDVEEAFAKAQQFYSRERMAAESGAVDKFNEVQGAYRLLIDPSARAAHDRKLAAALGARPAPVAQPRARASIADEQVKLPGYVKALAVAIALLLATGVALSYRNAQLRQEQQAQELADKRKAEAEEARQREEAKAADAQRRADQASAQAAERRFAMEAQQAAARAAAENRSREAAMASAQRSVLAEAQRQEANRLNEERRNAAEARRRVEQDKQRIRELCYQQYRRPDC